MEKPLAAHPYERGGYSSARLAEVNGEEKRKVEEEEEKRKQIEEETKRGELPLPPPPGMEQPGMGGPPGMGGQPGAGGQPGGGLAPPPQDNTIDSTEMNRESQTPGLDSEVNKAFLGKRR